MFVRREELQLEHGFLLGTGVDHLEHLPGCGRVEALDLEIAVDDLNGFAIGVGNPADLFQATVNLDLINGRGRFRDHRDDLTHIGAAAETTAVRVGHITRCVFNSVRVGRKYGRKVQRERPSALKAKRPVHVTSVRHSSIFPLP